MKAKQILELNQKAQDVLQAFESWANDFSGHILLFLNRYVADVKIAQIPCGFAWSYKWVWSWSCCHWELAPETLEVEHPALIVMKIWDVNDQCSFHLPLRKSV